MIIPTNLKIYTEKAKQTVCDFTESSELGSIAAIDVRNRLIRDEDVEIAGGVGGDVNAEQNPHLAGELDVGLKRQYAGGDVGKQSGVGEDAVAHQGEGEVELARVARANPAGGDGDVADVVAPVPQNRVAAVVPEPYSVGVVDGDGDVEAEVEQDPGRGDVEADVQVVEGDGGDGGAGVARLEDGEGEDEDEQA